MSFLIRISFKPDRSPTAETISRFPYWVPAIRTLGKVDTSSAITFFVGENGTGKSTLLEAIASAADLRSRTRSTIGTAEIGADSTLKSQRELGNALRLAWSPRTRDGFFMRAEDFFGWVTHADSDGGADALSHGESFMALFEARVKNTGLYLLDEPEAPLSPKSQIELARLIVDRARQGAQFIIATHSPVLLACPGARILSFDFAPIREVVYERVEHIAVLRSFLNDPGGYFE